MGLSCTSSTASYHAQIRARFGIVARLWIFCLGLNAVTNEKRAKGDALEVRMMYEVMMTYEVRMRLG